MDEKEINESEKYMNDTIVTFLTSSLNVELVHIILESITKYSKAKSIVPDMANHLNYTRKDFSEKNSFLIDAIKIQNPEKWKVAKLSDFILEEYDLRSNSQRTQPGNSMKDNRQPLLDRNTKLTTIPEEEEEPIVINEDVIVTEFAPKAFAFLRSLDGINND